MTPVSSPPLSQVCLSCQHIAPSLYLSLLQCSHNLLPTSIFGLLRHTHTHTQPFIFFFFYYCTSRASCERQREGHQHFTSPSSLCKSIQVHTTSKFLFVLCLPFLSTSSLLSLCNLLPPSRNLPSHLLSIYSPIPTSLPSLRPHPHISSVTSSLKGCL